MKTKVVVQFSAKVSYQASIEVDLPPGLDSNDTESLGEYIENNVPGWPEQIEKEDPDFTSTAEMGLEWELDYAELLEKPLEKQEKGTGGQ